MSHLNLSPTSLRRLRRPAPGRKQSGFSLLEALVSIVILSFGLLGVAGLQASSLKYTRDARNQSVAVNLAREMAEMIRSNARVSGSTDNDYLTVNPATPENLSDPDNPLPAPTAVQALGPVSTSTDKDEIAAALAAAQVADWKYRVAQALPGAHVVVCLDETPYDGGGLPQWACSDSGNIIAIKIGWEREDTKGEVKGATDAGVRPFVILPVTPAGQQ